MCVLTYNKRLSFVEKEMRSLLVEEILYDQSIRRLRDTAE